MKRNWILVGAVAAMLSACPGGVLAQDTTTGAASTDAGATGAASIDTINTTTAASMSNSMMSGTADYSLLNNKTFDYTDIAKARARGLSDTQVATVAKIAEKTGYSFRTIVDQVLNGNTFAKLADDYNLRLQDVLDASDEQTKIANYEAAYMNTGMRNVGMMSGDMAMSGSTSNGMSNGSMSAGPSTGMAGGMMSNKDIVDTAMGDKRFKTLVKELKKAGLVDTLKGPGPFTVFAPTDDAFKKLPKDALKNLENNPDQLKAVLTYHVLPARVDAATAMAMTSPTSPPTVQGGTLQVVTSNGTVMVNDAKVVQADIMATNGIIHAIDTVLMPADMATGGTGATGPGTDATGTGTTAPATEPGTPGTTPTPSTTPGQ